MSANKKSARPNIPLTRAVPKKPSAPADAAAAFAEIEPEVRAFDASQLVPINIDIPTAVSTVLGAATAIRPLRDDVAVQLPKFPLRLVDKLETYALAAWYAHIVALPPPAGNALVKDLVNQANPLRATLLSDAEALARRGLVPEQTVADIRAGQGHIDTANDLVALAALFTTTWKDVEGKTAATSEEVQRAAQLGPQLLAALGTRDQTRLTPSEAAERRARAFSLLVHTYDQTRRAIGYLRWDEEDADTIAPSLYRGRTRPTSDRSQPATPAPAAPASPAADHAAPVVAPGAAGSPPA